MSLQIPPDLDWLVKITAGQGWPKGDEDRMRALGREWKAFAGQLSGVTGEFEPVFRQVMDNISGQPAEQFGKFVTQMHQQLPALGEAGEQLAELSSKTAQQLEYSKYMIIAQSALLAAEIAWCVANAPLTAGGTMALVPGLIAASRLTVMQILKRLAMAVLFGVVSQFGLDVAVQAIMAIKAKLKGDDFSWNWQNTLGMVEMGAIGGAIGGGLHLGMNKLRPEGFGDTFSGMMINGGITGVTVTGISNVMNKDDGSLGYGLTSGLAGAIGSGGGRRGHGGGVPKMGEIHVGDVDKVHFDASDLSQDVPPAYELGDGPNSDPAAAPSYRRGDYEGLPGLDGVSNQMPTPRPVGVGDSGEGRGDPFATNLTPVGDRSGMPVGPPPGLSSSRPGDASTPGVHGEAPRPQTEQEAPTPARLSMPTAQPHSPTLQAAADSVRLSMPTAQPHSPTQQGASGSVRLPVPGEQPHPHAYQDAPASVPGGHLGPIERSSDRSVEQSNTLAHHEVPTRVVRPDDLPNAQAVPTPLESHHGVPQDRPSTNDVRNATGGDKPTAAPAPTRTTTQQPISVQTHGSVEKPPVADAPRIATDRGAPVQHQPAQFEPVSPGEPVVRSNEPQLPAASREPQPDAHVAVGDHRPAQVIDQLDLRLGASSELLGQPGHYLPKLPSEKVLGKMRPERRDELEQRHEEREAEYTRLKADVAELHVEEEVLPVLGGAGDVRLASVGPDLADDVRLGTQGLRDGQPLAPNGGRTDADAPVQQQFREHHDQRLATPSAPPFGSHRPDDEIRLTNEGPTTDDRGHAGPEAREVEHEPTAQPATRGGVDERVPTKNVADDESWRHAVDRPHDWFEPDHPFRPEQWEHLRRDDLSRRVHTEIVDVKNSSRVDERGRLHVDSYTGLVRYDLRRIEVTPGRFVQEYTVKLRLTGEDAHIAKAKRDVTAAVNELFNKGNRLPSGDQFHVRLEFVENRSEAHTEVSVGIRETDQRHWAVNEHPHKLAHEVLHFLGPGDEGNDPARVFLDDASKSAVVDDNGVLGGGVGGDVVELKPRNLWYVERVARDQVAVPDTRLGHSYDGVNLGRENPRVEHGDAAVELNTRPAPRRREEIRYIDSADYQIASRGGDAFQRYEDLDIARHGGFPERRPVHRIFAEDQPVLRVSSDNSIAINAGPGEIREVYALRSLADEANRRLRLAGSKVELVPDANHQIRIGDSRILYKVVPVFSGKTPDICRDFAAEVLGGQPDHLIFRRGPEAVEVAASADAPMEVTGVHKFAQQVATAVMVSGIDDLNPRWAAKIVAGDRRPTAQVGRHGLPSGAEYGSLLSSDDINHETMERAVRKLGINEHAEPKIGEAYMISSIPTADQLGNPAYNENHARAGGLGTVFGYHFGAVVLTSADGRTHVTIENYRRSAVFDALISDAVTKTLEKNWEKIDRVVRELDEAVRAAPHGTPDRSRAQQKLNLARALATMKAHDGNRDLPAYGNAARAAELAMGSLARIVQPGDLWSFHMYQPGGGLSFHENWGMVNTSANQAASIVNPLTVVAVGGHGGRSVVKISFEKNSVTFPNTGRIGITRMANALARDMLWRRENRLDYERVEITGHNPGLKHLPDVKNMGLRRAEAVAVELRTALDAELLRLQGHGGIVAARDANISVTSKGNDLSDFDQGTVSVVSVPANVRRQSVSVYRRERFDDTPQAGPPPTDAPVTQGDRGGVRGLLQRFRGRSASTSQQPEPVPSRRSDVERPTMSSGGRVRAESHGVFGSGEAERQVGGSSSRSRRPEQVPATDAPVEQPGHGGMLAFMRRNRGRSASTSQQPEPVPSRRSDVERPTMSSGGRVRAESHGVFGSGEAERRTGGSSSRSHQPERGHFPPRQSFDLGGQPVTDAPARRDGRDRSVVSSHRQGGRRASTSQRPDQEPLYRGQMDRPGTSGSGTGLNISSSAEAARYAAERAARSSSRQQDSATRRRHAGSRNDAPPSRPAPVRDESDGSSDELLRDVRQDSADHPATPAARGYGTAGHDPMKPVLDDESWRHSDDPAPDWFKPDEEPLHPTDWESLRRDDLARTVHTEIADVKTSSSIAEGGQHRFERYAGLVRYDLRRIEVSTGRFVQEYTVKLHVVGDPVHVEKAKRDATAAVDSLLNQGNRLPSGDQFHVRLEFPESAKEAHATVRVGEHSTDQTHWNAGENPIVLAHEVLHYLGPGDESLDRSRVFLDSERKSAVVNDHSLLGSLSRPDEVTLKPRHLWYVERVARDQVAVPDSRLGHDYAGLDLGRPNPRVEHESDETMSSHESDDSSRHPLTRLTPVQRHALSVAAARGAQFHEQNKAAAMDRVQRLNEVHRTTYPVDDLEQMGRILEAAHHHLQTMELVRNIDFGRAPTGAPGEPGRRPLTWAEYLSEYERFPTFWETGYTTGTPFRAGRGWVEEQQGYGRVLNRVAGDPTSRRDLTGEFEPTSPADMPLYGALLSRLQHGGAYSYGSSVLHLKEEVRQRTTYTPQDSAAYGPGGVEGYTDHAHLYGLLAYGHDPNVRLTLGGITGFRYDQEMHDAIVRDGHAAVGRYYEAQIHGGMSWHDVAKVTVNWGDLYGSQSKTTTKAEAEGQVAFLRSLAHERGYDLTVELGREIGADDGLHRAESSRALQLFGADHDDPIDRNTIAALDRLAKDTPFPSRANEQEMLLLADRAGITGEPDDQRLSDLFLRARGQIEAGEGIAGVRDAIGLTEQEHRRSPRAAHATGPSHVIAPHEDVIETRPAPGQAGDATREHSPDVFVSESRHGRTMFEARRLELEPDRWLREATLRVAIRDHDGGPLPDSISTDIFGQLRRAVDARFNDGDWLADGDEFRLNVVHTDDPSQAHTSVLLGAHGNLPHELAEHVGALLGLDRHEDNASAHGEHIDDGDRAVIDELRDMLADESTDELAADRRLDHVLLADRTGTTSLMRRMIEAVHDEEQLFGLADAHEYPSLVLTAVAEHVFAPQEVPDWREPVVPLRKIDQARAEVPASRVRGPVDYLVRRMEVMPGEWVHEVSLHLQLRDERGTSSPEVLDERFRDLTTGVAERFNQEFLMPDGEQFRLNVVRVDHEADAHAVFVIGDDGEPPLELADRVGDTLGLFTPGGVTVDQLAEIESRHQAVARAPYPPQGWPPPTSGLTVAGGDLARDDASLSDVYVRQPIPEPVVPGATDTGRVVPGAPDLTTLAAMITEHDGHRETVDLVVNMLQGTLDNTRVAEGEQAAGRLAAAIPAALRVLDSTGVLDQYLGQAGDAVTAGLSLVHVLETVARKWAVDGEPAATMMARAFLW
ncbi:hypothetical protein [Kutzneria sp. NPDC052558]|uniref:WXG100-like domain-containing protein n=1 Tax=Kutzneria sp. NPDC052558 TaxID=3364121 RepID=UPI0037C6EFB8